MSHTSYCSSMGLALLLLTMPLNEAAPQTPAERSVLLVPDKVWNGELDAPQSRIVVRIKGSKIDAVGSVTDVKAPPSAERVELPGTTLIPGLIEGHSHLFLHPYSETLWDDQVLKEPRAYRLVEAVAH